jgi:hypothetical protein
MTQPTDRLEQAKREIDEENQTSLFGPVWEALVAERARNLELRCALREIAEKDIVCECSHDTEDCCAKVGVFCAHCIAETALKRTEP